MMTEGVEGEVRVCRVSSSYCRTHKRSYAQKIKFVIIKMSFSPCMNFAHLEAKFGPSFEDNGTLFKKKEEKKNGNDYVRNWSFFSADGFIFDIFLPAFFTMGLFGGKHLSVLFKYLVFVSRGWERVWCRVVGFSRGFCGGWGG